MSKKHFLTERPDIAAEWDYSANGDITPNDVALMSHKERHWICSKGHKFKLAVSKRTCRGYGCPYCSGKRPIIGETDFKTLFPSIAAEWDYNRNQLPPEQYLPHSNVKVHWICKKGHSFQCQIKDRTEKKVICPVCYGRYPIPGKTDLETVFPELAKEWSKKNRNLLPSQVSAYSNRTVWWKCSVCGREWRAIIKNRAYGRGCYECYKRKHAAE